MIRHLIPRVAWSDWTGVALTERPGAGEEMPPGIARNMRKAFGQSTLIPVNDEATGRALVIQWLSLVIELNIGRVA